MTNSNCTDINSTIESIQQVLIQDLQVRTSAEQLLLEAKCTNCIQGLVEIANVRILKNFSLKVEMECDDNDNSSFFGSSENLTSPRLTMNLGDNSNE
jgi:hypothetical protein